MKSRQQQDVLREMRVHGSITSIVAFEKYRITRLSAVIFELKKHGYNIISQECYYTNSYGETKRYAEYFLGADDADNNSRG